MLNQFVVVGRIVNDLEIEKNGEKVTTSVKIAVPRSYKNINGEYDTDFLNIKLWNGVAENTVNYCKKGDLIGAKGRVQSENNSMELIADKITFLSSKKYEEVEEEEEEEE